MKSFDDDNPNSNKENYSIFLNSRSWNTSGIDSLIKSPLNSTLFPSPSPFTFTFIVWLRLTVRLI
jgi:hypothetical protein